MKNNTNRIITVGAVPTGCSGKIHQKDWVLSKKGICSVIHATTYKDPIRVIVWTKK